MQGAKNRRIKNMPVEILTINDIMATIIPLDYSMNGEPRKEHSIAVAVPDFAKLMELFESPGTYLNKLGESFVQVVRPPNKFIDWVFRPNVPVAARVESIYEFLSSGSSQFQYDTLRGLSIVAMCLNLKLDQLFQAFSEHAGGLRESHLEMEATMAFRLAVEEVISKAFPKGGFIAEFAPGTSSLHVIYVPPPESLGKLAGAIANPSAPPALGTYQDKFTMVTVGMLQEMPVGTAHFDIGKGRAAQAKFIVDHLENCGRTCYHLNNDHPAYYNFNADFVPRNGVIDPKQVDPSTNHRAFTIKSKYKYGSDINVATDAYPVMHIENLSWKIYPTKGPTGKLEAVEAGELPSELAEEEEEMCICGLVPVFIDSQSIVLGPITLKAYPPPC
jgi:hypothetical protein